ncbi:MAG: amylo-alpha-1,6-glucosidase [Candidatus Sericytochromatia bacterium]|nr:amylo-alpha-1,6-glucosidase [Candidatus Tanganyikabacteria bacterium]
MPSEVAAPEERAHATCPHSRVAIKRGPVFAVSHTDGMIDGRCACGQGLYFRDTRHLSRLEWRVGPAALPASLKALAYDADSGVMARGHYLHDGNVLLALSRELDGALFDTLVVTNHGRSPVSLEVACTFSADFLDMFAVRGFSGVPRSPGKHLEPNSQGDTVRLGYEGIDELRRETVLIFEPVPARLTTEQAVFEVRLAPHEECEIRLACHPGSPPRPERQPAPAVARPAPAAAHAAALGEFARISSTNPLFERFLARGTQDLLALLLPTEEGPYFAAGLPWYACPFGRDGLITAYQALPLHPEPAIGTLRYLAARQGRHQDATRDEEPGKILHESRVGELSKSGIVPFAPSYCTVDATPLFLILLHETWRWTGDLDLVRELWPNARAALGWIDRSADARGFLAYRRQGQKGLSNQGWKDSWDAILHPDGTVPAGGIALAEVQGYAYDARRRMAELAEALGEPELAATWRAVAAGLREAFASHFWLPDRGYFAIALDGAGNPVDAPASNQGQCLWSGLLDLPQAQAVRDVLVGPGLFSGWGIRTLSAESPNYNPVSYHNGSVWPHDNALIAAGLARYGYVAEAARIAEALFAVARTDPLQRLPELFCGFERRAADRPVPYPVACVPQAWAAGTPALLLRALLGLKASAADRRLTLARPYLPEWAGTVTLAGLRVGGATVSLRCAGSAVEILEATGGLVVEVQDRASVPPAPLPGGRDDGPSRTG